MTHSIHSRFLQLIQQELNQTGQFIMSQAKLEQLIDQARQDRYFRKDLEL